MQELIILINKKQIYEVDEGEIMPYMQLINIQRNQRDKYEEVYKSRYESESTFRYEFNIKSNEAFLVINKDIILKIDKILSLNSQLIELLGELSKISQIQFTRYCLVEEVKITNEIEGVNSTRKEIKAILNTDEKKKSNQRLYGLVKKYQYLDKKEIALDNCEDIRMLYDELVLDEVIEENFKNRPDGLLFRKEKVYVQSSTMEVIHEGIAPEEKIIELLSKSLELLQRKDHNFLIGIAVFHYMFGYIHPFYDGNGRISRFISSYLLSKKLHQLVSYRLSYSINLNKSKYYKMFKDANEERNRGELTYFVNGFFDLLVESITSLIDIISEKKEQLEYFEGILASLVGNNRREILAASILLQNSLFGMEGLNVKELAQACDLSISKTRRTISSLDDKGLFRKTTISRAIHYDIDIDKLLEKNIDNTKHQ